MCAISLGRRDVLSLPAFSTVTMVSFVEVALEYSFQNNPGSTRVARLVPNLSNPENGGQNE